MSLLLVILVGGRWWRDRLVSQPGTKVAEVPPANLGAGVVPPLAKGAAWGPSIINEAFTELPAKEGVVWLLQINTMVER